MVLPKAEKEWGERASAFLKAEMKKADVTYAELVKRLKKHGLKDETEAGTTMKLKRGSFTAIFFLACVAALGCVDSWDSQIRGNVIQGFLLGGSLGCHGSARSERPAMGPDLRHDHRSAGPAWFDGPRQPDVCRGRVMDRANRFAVA
ncbi:DUF6471 domain-containing protein [Bradyrhizobium sp. USDA 3315]